MSRASARAVALALALTVLAASAGASSRQITEKLLAPREGAVGIVFKAGELEIVGGDGDELRFDLRLRCERPSARCERRLASAEIVSRATTQTLQVEVTGLSKRAARKLDLEGRVEVPRRAALTVDMGAGELAIRGLEADVTVDLKFGEASLELPEAAVGAAHLRARIGETALYGISGSPRIRRPLVVGGRVDWSGGEGEAVVQVRVRIGSVTVDLR